MEIHEQDANEAIAINAINRRLSAIGRSNWGIVDVSAKHVICGALAQIINDKVSPAYAAQADVDAPEQEANEALQEAGEAFARERAA